MLGPWQHACASTVTDTNEGKTPINNSLWKGAARPTEPNRQCSGTPSCVITPPCKPALGLDALLRGLHRVPRGQHRGHTPLHTTHPATIYHQLSAALTR